MEINLLNKILDSTLYSTIIAGIFIIIGLISINKKDQNQAWMLLGIISFLIVLIIGLSFIKDLF